TEKNAAEKIATNIYDQKIDIELKGTLKSLQKQAKELFSAAATNDAQKVNSATVVLAQTISNANTDSQTEEFKKYISPTTLQNKQKFIQLNVKDKDNTTELFILENAFSKNEYAGGGSRSIEKQAGKWISNAKEAEKAQKQWQTTAEQQVEKTKKEL